MIITQFCSAIKPFSETKLMNFNDSSLCDDLSQALGDGAQLIDVRSPAECALGMLPEAVNVPLNELADAQKTLRFDKPILFYCRSGHRSEMARRYFTELGHTDCWNIGAYESLRRC